ncbi:hypothetical protein MTR67_017699 [Solanum verrucosum]|uniref:Uncharacterized protein n=1 Tax=Solanum verrucosum TaxID=315347 RepID=A0AAF0QIE8_SOLVR|nr:hypothetical protein MTR67_017699 [Solanum verrucosum]
MVEFIQFGMLNDYWTEYFTKPTTDVFDDALDVALDHDVLDVAGQILKRRKCTNPHLTNLLDCILSLSKLVVSINYTRNVDTPLGCQIEETNLRKCVAWVFDISVYRDKTSLLVPLAKKEYIETKGYIAPKGNTKLLVTVLSHVYNVEIVFFESLCLLNSLLVIGQIWSTVMLVGNAIRELSTLASNHCWYCWLKLVGDGENGSNLIGEGVEEEKKALRLCLV